jgi:hypothetical protein
VRSFNPGANLFQHAVGSLHGNRAFASEQMIKRFTFDVFHHQKEHAFFAFAKVGHADNVRVLNRRGGPGFALKTGDRLAFLEIFV